MGTEKNKVYRFERKFFISNLRGSEVKSIVKFHPYMFSEIFHKRHVNNIYFDTMNFDNYSDNVEGSSNRVKFRIRWYGDMFGFIEKPVLELKIKNSMLGRKESYKLKSFTLDKIFDSSVIEKVFIDSDLPEPIKYRLKFLMPSLLNRYVREYFMSTDKKFRITIDSEQVFVGIGKNFNCFLNRFNDNENTILELKYDQDHDSKANLVTNQFPFRLTKSSKYVNGVSKINFDIY